jgi:hypothetical protein
MVPRFFVPLVDFPYNTNGKVDRKLLPPPGASPNSRPVAGG